MSSKGIYSSGKQQLEIEDQQRKQKPPTVGIIELRAILDNIQKTAAAAIQKLPLTLEEREKTLLTGESKLAKAKTVEEQLLIIKAEVEEEASSLNVALRQIQEASIALSQLVEAKLGNLKEERETLANINRVLNQY